MDTALSPTVIKRRRFKLFIIVTISLVAFAGVIWLLQFSLSSSLERSAITTAVVETGNVENTINATGEILPEFEQVITSPINAVIRNVLIDAGREVKMGTAVLELDKEFTQIELEKLKFELELKQNNISKLRLQLDKSFYDLKANDSVKQLKINSLEAEVRDAKRLFQAGGGTRGDVEQAELNLKIAQLEKRQLENEIHNKQMTMRADMRESEISAQIQHQSLNELERKLVQANVVAPRNGVVTWVNKNIGSKITEGESLVKIADLGSFKVTGSISDAFAEQVRTGMPVSVHINDSSLRGVVMNIHPSIENNIVSFDVELDDRSNKLLRPHMKVDIFLVTGISKQVMRVANGPAFKGGAVQDLFIMEGNKAVRRPVPIGLSNFDFVELKRNVKPGDVIIITDMSSYKHTNEITIKD